MTVYNLILQGASNSGSSIPGLGSSTPSPSFLGPYLTSAFAIVGAILFYPIALIAGLGAIVTRKMTIPAGVISILTGTLWFFGVESLKSTLAEQLQQYSSALGGLISTAISSILTVGYGTYVIIFAGILFIIGYFVSK